MTYVPMSSSGAVTLRAGRDPGPTKACAPTPTLVQSLGADSTTDEADFAALSSAGVLALVGVTEPRRLVLAIEVDPSQVTDRRTGYGEIEVTGLRWSQVQSLFADEPAAAGAVAAARSAARAAGGLADALAAPAVEELVDTYDLLWFAAAELDQVAEAH